MNYYVLHVWGDVEPVLHGPYKTAEERDDHALIIRADDDSEGGIYALQVGVQGHTGAESKSIFPLAVVEVGTYSGGFFDDE
jgi:hypothetical protein